MSVASNEGRFDGGRGIEGIGVPPHEVVHYDPGDLAEGRDTPIPRAEGVPVALRHLDLVRSEPL